MQIARSIAGYSLGRADVLRGAMSKKKIAVMEGERVLFIEGALKNGIPKDTAVSIFEEMSEFAKYGFNKSHAAGYAVIAYETAYLKANYPAMFMAALLTSVTGNITKTKEYIAECLRIGIKISPPDVNISLDTFFADENGIYYGLGAVKNAGRSLAEAIVHEREQNGKYTDYADFIARLGDQLNRRAVECLVKCGAFDCFGFTRRHMLSVYDKVMFDVLIQKKQDSENQLSFFDSDNSIPYNADYFSNPLDEFEMSKKLEFEKESLGLYLSEHPLHQLKSIYDLGKYSLISDVLDEDFVERRVVLLGIIDSVRVITTKKMQDMAYVSLEDISAGIDIVVFPSTFEKLKSQLEAGSLVEIMGEISDRDEQNRQVKCISMKILNRDSLLNTGKKLYVNFISQKSATYGNVLKLLASCPGDNSCVFHFMDTGKTVSTGDKLRVRTDYALVKELEAMLGAENIVIK